MKDSAIAEAITGYRSGYAAIHPPAIIAEAGVNHEGSIDLARRLVDEAAAGGADAIKFQTYRAETLAVADSPAYWDTTKESTPTQRKLFAKYDRLWQEDFELLRRHSEDAGVEFMSTPFDRESAIFLADLVSVFKVASADITNVPFLRLIASFGKPVVLSTGAATLGEIAAALDILTPRVPVCLMHCILNYPTAHEDANLGMILDLRTRFPDTVPGYSDHTIPDATMSVPVTAALLGARVIEKHFTFDKSLPGNDHYHAMDLADLRLLRRSLAQAFTLVGDASKHPLPSEDPARRYARRSLVAARDIPAGQLITEDDLTWKRPATGISPAAIDEVLGRRARLDIPSDSVLEWRHLE
jgi:N-acetylneuraminate synthase